MSEARDFKLDKLLSMAGQTLSTHGKQYQGDAVRLSELHVLSSFCGSHISEQDMPN